MKTRFFLCVFFFCKNSGQKNCTKNVQPFPNIFFSFFKQIKKIGVEGFSICLYFIGVGGNENLKKFLAWP